MPRLFKDRYLAYDEIHGCDLATGDEVRLDRLADDPSGEAFPALIEVLSDGRDGSPRWVVADVRNGAQAAAMARRAAADARAHGFVPMLVALYLRLREVLGGDLDERALLLIGGTGQSATSARAALLDAAARSARPHVLLTFRTGPAGERGHVVREARARYGAQPRADHRAGAHLAPDVARHLERAARASEFQRRGRHAAAERLLRDVAGMLTRRHAWVPAGGACIMLGRALLERGQAAGADKAFAEAARLGEAAGEEGLVIDARLWQAAARTDAGRLSDAESMCRAVLLTQALPPTRLPWAQALLARVLCWQGRASEALSPGVPSEAASLFDEDALIAASIDATAVRVLLAVGDLFQAGQRARALVARTEAIVDPLPRLVALAAHFRVLAAAGDLHLAEQQLQAVCHLAREAHAPLRGMRARLIWHDALRRAGRLRDAQQELDRLSRMGRAAPALLRRAVEQRLAGGGEPPKDTGVVAAGTSSSGSSIAAALIHLVHDEACDADALQRLLDRIWRELGPSRVDVVSADAGPATTLVTAGAGLPTRSGQRVLDAGIVIAAELEHGGREIGVPIRLSGRLLAAAVCRWPLDRQPPAHAVEVLTLAAAVAAPRVDALLTGRRDAARASTAVPELIGLSAGMAEVRRAIERAARAPFAVFIEGESGVGKELAARAIHQLSPRRERRFCDVNCAALPDELLDSELFGHARGAFTGAVADKAGLFEDADGGTVFLDEVADLSPRGQAKLLRVLQQQEVRRVGETFARAIDVRLVTAANRDMRLEAADGRFRSDLLYRLDVIRIRIPPLRERPEDVAVLARHFWRAAAERVGSSAALAHGVLAELARYHWPGNVRELQNVMAALAVAAPARGRVAPSLLPAAITGAASITSRTLVEARAQFERRFVEVALARAAGSRTRAAAELGLSRQGLLKTMARLGVEGT